MVECFKHASNLLNLADSRKRIINVWESEGRGTAWKKDLVRLCTMTKNYINSVEHPLYELSQQSEKACNKCTLITRSCFKVIFVLISAVLVGM
jgi:hypothetical protein